MKISRNGKIIVSLLVGTALMGATAFADVVLGSGYYSLKESVKRTYKELYTGTDSFTCSGSVRALLDGDVIAEEVVAEKRDIRQNKEESANTIFNKKDGEKSYFHYSDSEKYVYSGYDGSLYVNYRSEENDEDEFEDVFEQEQVKDAEKVLDAFVGSLKDIVHLEENSGKKIYTANITESQIPTLANAVAAFGVKYSIMDERTAENMGIENRLVKDLYVEEASAKVMENENGIITSAAASGTIVGKDENGTERILSVEITFDVTDINSTVIEEPDISGAEISYSSNEGYNVSEKYIGKYKNIILDDDMNKLGERYITIDSVNDETVTGTYTISYSEDDTVTFDFTADNTQERWDYFINYTDANGEEQTGVLCFDYKGVIRADFGVTRYSDGGYSSDDEFGGNNIFVIDFD